MQLVKAFTQLPNVYILKRYTRDVRSFIEWDQNDMQKDGQDVNRADMRFAKLVPIVIGIVRANTKSDYACEEAYERSTTLRALIETIPVSVSRSAPTGDEGTDVNVEGDYTVAIVAPPASQTKGCGPGRSNLQNEVTGGAQCTSTYKCKRTVDGHEVIGSRSCGVCGLKGHYMTTCPMNPKRSCMVEKRGISRGGVRKRG
jgi:hypothetical protein